MKRVFQLYVIGHRVHSVDLYAPKDKIITDVLQHLNTDGFGRLVVKNGDNQDIPSLTLTIPSFYPSVEVMKCVGNWAARLETMLVTFSRQRSAQVQKDIEHLKRYYEELIYWAGKTPVANIDQIHPRYHPDLKKLDVDFTKESEGAPCHPSPKSRPD